MAKQVWMTAEGYQQLQERLERLRSEKRASLVQALQEARGEGDWRENSQLILAQNELAQVDQEIRRVSEMLENSKIVEPHGGDATVEIGETVVLQMDGDVETYTIVSPAETAPEQGRISYESPVGHSLLKHKVGDDVTVHAPAGDLHCRIVAVR